MFRGSGAMDLLTDMLRPLVAPIGFPPELVPLGILRSLTGKWLCSRLYHRPHHDRTVQIRVIGRTAATMYGSTETTFYVLAGVFRSGERAADAASRGAGGADSRTWVAAARGSDRLVA